VPVRSIRFVPFSRWAQFFLGIVFFVAAAAKSIDLVRFSRQVEAILIAMGFTDSILLAAASDAIAMGIVILEAYLGASLLSGYKGNRSAGILIGLLICFTALVVWALMQGSKLDCGCFGGIVTRSAQEAIIDDVVLLVLAFFAARNKYPERRGAWLMISSCLVAVSWIIFFYFNPLPSSALRPGSKVPASVQKTLPKRHTYRYFWFFDPDCKACQNALPMVSLIAHSSDNRLLGISRGSEGRAAEFSYDFKPEFTVVAIDDSSYTSIGVPNGSLVEQRAGRVTRLWPAFLLDPIQIGRGNH
jgi:hypothetical protein